MDLDFLRDIGGVVAVLREEKEPSDQSFQVRYLFRTQRNDRLHMSRLPCRHQSGRDDDGEQQDTCVAEAVMLKTDSRRSARMP